MEFNNKLYELRKQKGFSQEELANRLNVSRQTVSKWEVGDSTPDMEKLVAMSDLFGISLDELVLDKSPEPAPVEQVPVKSELYSDAVSLSVQNACNIHTVIRYNMSGRTIKQSISSTVGKTIHNINPIS